ncbi:MAG: hypothetical protein R2851_02280 [Caldilineaceae bacterium]
MARYMREARPRRPTPPSTLRDASSRQAVLLDDLGRLRSRQRRLELFRRFQVNPVAGTLVRHARCAWR